jgi:phosphate-transporting ATPase
MSERAEAVTPLLSIRELSRSGVEPFDLDLNAGEPIALLGPSGSGKTLFLRAIADLDPNEGQARLDGRPREDMSAPDWRRAVTYLAAEPGWWAERARDHFPDLESAREVLPRIGLHPDKLAQPMTELSTGERHRLALARVLLQNPKVLLLDEPTSGLDEGSTRAVESVLWQLAREGRGLLFSTHDEAFAHRLGQRILRVSHGRIEERQEETAR